MRVSLDWFVGAERVEAFEGWSFEAQSDALTVRFGDEAEYRIHVSGDQGHVEVLLGPANERQAALSFVLAVLPLSLPLFDLEPFHGSSVAIPDGGAVLVLGPAEAGKSTTLAALRAKGLRFLADDACAIDSDGSLWPGPPLLAIRSAPAAEERFAVYDGKTVVAIDDHDLAPRPVEAAVVLGPRVGAPLNVTSLHGREAVTALLEQVRSPWILPALRERLQFQAAISLARHRVGVVAYDKTKHEPLDVADAILSWAGGP